MHIEASIAANFITNYLYNKLPRLRVQTFGLELDKFIKAKIADHWHPDQPLKGAAYRCLRATGAHADEVMFLSAKSGGLDIFEIFAYLPPNLTLWIDPGEVSYKIGETGLVNILYSENSTSENISSIDSQQSINDLDDQLMYSYILKPERYNNSNNSNPSLHFNVSENSVGSATHSPTNVPFCQNVPYIISENNNNNTQNIVTNPYNSTRFTTATFAQTKFGSVKLKSQSKRPNCLSPNNSFVGVGSGAFTMPSSQPKLFPLETSSPQFSTSGAFPNQFRSASLSPASSQPPQSKSIQIPLIFPQLQRRSRFCNSVDPFPGFMSIQIPPMVSAAGGNQVMITSRGNSVAGFTQIDSSQQHSNADGVNKCSENNMNALNVSCGILVP